MEVSSYDSWEDACKAMEDALTVANSKVKPWQAAIKPGDKFLQATTYGFWIIGEVLESNCEYHKSPAGKYFRFCRCWSIAVPDSEIGDVHCSVLTAKITDEQFEKYRAANWVVEDAD